MTLKSSPAAGQPPDGCCSDGGNLLSVDDAIERAIALAGPVDGFETLALGSARGRAIMDTITARLPLPNFDNSAMDGYALNTKSLKGSGPYRLAVTGRMAAGDADTHSGDKTPSGALRILTGALVPANYDAVIMQEKVTLKDGCISFEKAPQPGANIRPRGQDCQPGTAVIAAGTCLEARHIAMLAAQGFSEVRVRRKVRVAIFSTGSELRQPGEQLLSGQIYNSNRYALSCQLDRPFVEVIDLGAIRDDYETLRQTTASAARMADMVISTGGVSVGDEDHMPGIITDLGGRLHVMKVAIKPGKPVTVGTIGSCIYLGLPGNPVAAFINQILMGGPVIRKLAGLEAVPPASYPAIAAFARKSSPAFEEYVPARITGRSANATPVVEAFEKAGSASLAPLAASDGFVILPLGSGNIKAGDIVQFIPH